MLGCTNNNKIILDHTTQYNIQPGISSTHVSQIESDFYKSLFTNSMENSLVLYKVLKGDNFKIYIGVGFETTIEELKVKILSAQKSSIVSCDSTDVNSIKIFERIDASVHLVHYLKKLDSGNKYIFSAISYSENIINESFVAKYFESQLITQ
jgi:hypothetical protein